MSRFLWVSNPQWGEAFFLWSEGRAHTFLGTKGGGVSPLLVGRGSGHGSEGEKKRKVRRPGGESRFFFPADSVAGALAHWREHRSIVRAACQEEDAHPLNADAPCRCERAYRALHPSSGPTWANRASDRNPDGPKPVYGVWWSRISAEQSEDPRCGGVEQGPRGTRQTGQVSQTI
jgi:hypothetical protein